MQESLAYIFSMRTLFLSIVVCFVLLGSNSIGSVHLSHERYFILQEGAPGSIYNDYTEDRYNEVLNRFMRIMGPYVEKRGGRLRILRDWTDGAVNAWAWFEGEEYWLEVPGGAARYHLINEEAFLATVCHELGHLMGGSPSNDYKVSYEGQADYFSSSKCLRIVLKEIEPFRVIEPSLEVRESCSRWAGATERSLCERSLVGALSLTSYYAELEKAQKPLVSTPSKERAKKTNKTHPKAQCRLDTYVAGALCPASPEEEFQYGDASQGACHEGYYPEYARPSCWFKN